MTNPITKYEDIIDSRDVIARIEELEAEQAGLVEQLSEGEISESDMLDFDREEGKELDALHELAEEAAPYAADWFYGEALIRYSYFEEYAQQLAEDCGMVNADARWPNNHIDWEAAAAELEQDYTTVSFDGVDYFIR